MKPMLAKSYADQPVNGWLMSEKLDGVRAIWDGEKLVSRNGHQFFAPAWFTEALPKDCWLDGELFMGRGLFQRTVACVRKHIPVDDEWRAIRYCVFDAPHAHGLFEARIAFCADILARCPVAQVVHHEIAKSKSHLDRYFFSLCALGAEGVMLRNPKSAYEQKRSANLLKYKPLESAEAEVMDHVPGEGKHSGRLGALVCKWCDVVFNLGTGFSDWMRSDPPAKGCRVSFAYQGLTDGGVPRFPVFLAVRDYE